MRASLVIEAEAEGEVEEDGARARVAKAEGAEGEVTGKWKDIINLATSLNFFSIAGPEPKVLIHSFGFTYFQIKILHFIILYFSFI